MDFSSYLEKCLSLDLETSGERILKIGAICGGAIFERKGKFDIRRAFEELDQFSKSAEVVIGHNILEHDLPIMQRVVPILGIYNKPVIDTLFLSPLAFPENPYHRLVKDYKLVKDSVSDPVADCRLVLSVFRDQWESFAAMAAEGYSDILSFYRFCFAPRDGMEKPGFGGMASLFVRLGAEEISGDQAGKTMERHVADRVCGNALREVLADESESDAKTPALAYAVAWLRFAGTNSVLPPWVRKRFPLVTEIIRKLRDVACNDEDCVYCRNTHDSEAQLKHYFAFSEFRPKPPAEDGRSLQNVVVDHGMKDKPLLAIFPTGGGKSICYQLPALVRYFRRGLLTIVISPLQALMKDQVDNLAEKTGTPYAAALNGLLTPPERGEVLARIALGDVAILYVAPEQFRNSSFRTAIRQREIGAWVFDEAHCLSKWGHDFRPDYLYAGRFIREFSGEQKLPVAPVSCFTATAKKDVVNEIIDFFKREIGQELFLFEGGVERENLHFEVRTVTRNEKFSTISEVLGERLAANISGSAIVYVATRNNAELAAGFLKERGWAAAAFHGGLNAAEKRIVQEEFIRGSLQVIVATNAFGMGVDKGDVRLVVHADIPGSLESYIQEAGRAGRDLFDAECVLLYDDQDIETQFKLGAMSQLNQRDIAQILRGIRRAKRGNSEDVVITAGELLRDEEVETSFDLSDLQADTKVKTAVAWLERARFVERNENHTRVFQGSLLVKDLEDARRRIDKLNLSEPQKKRWLAILGAMMNSRIDEGLSADSLAELPEVAEFESGQAGFNQRQETASQRVLRTLHDMTMSGLIEKGLVLTAFVRYKCKSPSHHILERVCHIENDMLKILREETPDAADLGWLDLSLQKTNQRLRDLGHECNPDLLRTIIKSISLDGRGLAGARGSLQYRHIHQDYFKIKLLRDWNALTATVKKRQEIAKTILDVIFSRIPPDSAPSAELLVSFSSEDLAKGFQSHLYLSQGVKDPLAAIDRGLLFLHEQRAIILQQGLAVFRQAMSICVLPESGKRKYTKQEYEPLAHHYRERVFQVHVMNEYARLGIREISGALGLILAYFTLDKIGFIRRYFPGKKEMLERATSQESYSRIVEDLANPDQMSIVAGDEQTNTLVLAGPGAGKTKVIIHRCAYLVRVRRVPPESILIVCFNHSAAVELRRKLSNLLGEDAKGVTVQTYHGIAMRLTGTTFSEIAEKITGRELPFDRLIPEAIVLLKGDADLPGLDPAEIRDRMLGRFRHILVDEYQDIDQEQYDLVSALAGRTERDPDIRLTICAVGDDDQNIYTFRGANIQFISKFSEDYAAKIHYLTENYRSTSNIISASNLFISRNRDRMKTGHPIRINASRGTDPPGGKWEKSDPASQGRVQILEVADIASQAGTLIAELKRMKDFDPALNWSDFAVLSRTRDILHLIRAACEHHGIPVSWGFGRDNVPPLTRIREITQFLDLLRPLRLEFRRASDLESLLFETPGGGPRNPWFRLLGNILAAWREESADSELPVSITIERICEELAEMRRDHRLGEGVFLSTIHGVKGMEFPLVFILDGNWVKTHSVRDMEEERRIVYVGMTRAKETLTIFHLITASNPYLSGISGDFAIRRRADVCESILQDLLKTRYDTLGMRDLVMGYAGRFPEDHGIHSRLKNLAPGSPLFFKAGDRDVIICNSEGQQVAALSRRGQEFWVPRLHQIRSGKLTGMVRRNRADEQEDFRDASLVDAWEIPWFEVVSVTD